MRRGTTPTNRFTTKLDLRDAEEAYMSYAQDEEVVFEKTLEDFVIEEIDDPCGEEGSKKFLIKIKLTQQETLALSIEEPVEIQCRALFPDDSAPASGIIRVPVERIIKEGVI